MQPLFRLPFLEDTTPPPFYRPELSDAKRKQLDVWFLGTRSQAYYLKRFAQMDEAGRLLPSWNWAAFFMAFGWLLYRKRFLDCFVYCVAGLSFVKLMIVLSLVFLEFFVTSRLDVTWQMPFRIFVAALVWVFWAGMVARWANAYYYRMARREIADALDLYPREPEAQKAHLKQHGGTSLLGMGVAFCLYGSFLGVLTTFFPMWADRQEDAIVYQSYQALSHARTRVEGIYQAQGSCPVGLSLAADEQPMSMTVLDRAEGVDSDCVILLTIEKARYPVRYLNGQTMFLYRLKGTDEAGVWRCQSSLGKSATPKQCVR